MTEFKERAESFLNELGTLQEKYSVNIRPVITKYGPDIEMNDTEVKDEGEIVYEPVNEEIK